MFKLIKNFISRRRANRILKEAKEIMDYVSKNKTEASE
jgi:hypothetical protein